MNRWLALLVLFPALCSAQAMQEAQFGVAETFLFRLFNADGTLDVDEVDVGTEVTLMCDEGTPATATNDFVDEGTAYSIALTAAEMECARIEVHIGATVANSFIIYTWGDVRAFDTGRGVASGTAAAVTATNIDLDASGNFADDELTDHSIVITGATAGDGQCRGITTFTNTNQRATVDAWHTTPTGTVEYLVRAGSCNANLSIDANNRVAADTQAISGDVVAADNAELFFDDTGFAASNSTIGTVTTLTGHTAQTGDNYAGLEQHRRTDAVVINCEVNDANTTPTAQIVPCILTDRDDMAVTAVADTFEQREILVTSGALFGERRNIVGSSVASGELLISLDRALPGIPADAVTILIR